MATIIDPTTIVLGNKSFTEFEEETYTRHQNEADAEIIEKVSQLLTSDWLLSMLRVYGARTAFRFCGYRRVKIRLGSGKSYSVESPVFVKAKPKDKRRRRYRKDVLRHFGLEYLGFHCRWSSLLSRKSVQVAALCPSFHIGAQTLTELGTQMNHRLLRRITYSLGKLTMENRTVDVVDDEYRKPGLRYLICIDGGRIRQRTPRKGRKAKKAKRRGYHSDWRAPYLLTIVCVDEKGKIRKKLRPIYDGTVEKIDEAFDLLADYLGQLNIAEADSVVFCADGGEGIWPRIDVLAASLPLSQERIYRVLDYTHAKQNLREIVDLIHQAVGIWDYEYNDVLAYLKSLLWKGKIDQIETFINERLGRKRQKKKALKKLRDYFGDAKKFQYAAFRAAGIPTGSGTVESAIRRVINLRIKGPGLFWYLENAGKMIFLRSQVLSQRWQSVLESALDRRTKSFEIHLLENQRAVA